MKKNKSQNFLMFTGAVMFVMAGTIALYIATDRLIKSIDPEDSGSGDWSLDEKEIKLD